MRGNYFSDNFTYLEITFKKCDSTIRKCANTTEAAEYFANHPLELQYLDAEIKLDDFSTHPVTYAINTDFYMYIDTHQEKIMDMFVSPLSF